MTYTNSFEEDRFLSTVNREAEAFKKLIDDRTVSLACQSGLINRVWLFRYSTITPGHLCGITSRDQRRPTRLVMPVEMELARKRGYVLLQ
jgi:hypothetical protein